MQLALRPYVTTGIVIAGASALVAAPLAIPPSALNQPTVAIAPTASALGGAIDGFDTLVTNGGKSAQVLLNAMGAFPDELSRALLAAADDPQVLPTLGSAFLYGLLSPSPVSGTDSVLVGLAKQLPAPLGTSLLNEFRALGALVAHALPELPSPIPGLGAMEAVDLPPVVDVVTKDLGIIGEKFGEQAAFTAAFVGDLPNNFLRFVHAAAASPEDIPTLATNFGLSEMTDLGNAVFGPLVCILEDTLPYPVGTADGLVVKAVTQLLAVMPKPAADPELKTTSNVEPQATSLDQQRENGGQEEQNTGGSPGTSTFLKLAGPTDPGPTLVKKNDVDTSSGPRLNVLRVNPLADLDNRASVGDKSSTNSTATPRPHAHVMQQLAQAPAAIAHSIRDALKPQHSEASAGADAAN
jgi:hypothetical protein